MENESKPEAKLFVDEDWKSRVEAEKLAAAQKAESPKPDIAAEATPVADVEVATKPASATDSPDKAPRESLLPPATFSFLITTLATQAMVSLGQAPNPFTGKSDVHLPEAKHFIDTLGMLDAKTRKGNRTAEESALLDGFLHQLAAGVCRDEVVAGDVICPNGATSQSPGLDAQRPTLGRSAKKDEPTPKGLHQVLTVTQPRWGRIVIRSNQVLRVAACGGQPWALRCSSRWATP